MRDVLAQEAPREIGGERRLAAPQMGAAGDLELDAVSAVRGGPRAVAGAPFGEPVERRGIGFRRGRRGGEGGQKGQRVGQRHARSQPGRRRRGIDRGKKAPPARRGDSGEGRLVSRRAVFPIRERKARHRAEPAQPVDRPARQKEIHDPSHRRPPHPRCPARRRARAAVRPASAAGRSRALPSCRPRAARATRQRVSAALGRSRSAAASAALRQRRRMRAVTPERSAASCKRRPATIGSGPISPTTAASPAAGPVRSPSSTAHRISSSRRALTSTRRAGSSPWAKRPGP